MDQYLLIQFLGGWTSINPSYFDVNYRGTRFWHTAICIPETTRNEFGMFAQSISNTPWTYRMRQPMVADELKTEPGMKLSWIDPLLCWMQFPSISNELISFAWENPADVFLKNTWRTGTHLPVWNRWNGPVVLGLHTSEATHRLIAGGQKHHHGSPWLNVEKPPQHEQRASSDTVWYSPRESWTSRFRMLQKLLMGRTWVPMEAEHHMHSYARFPTLHSTWTIISNYHIISCFFLWLISWYQLNILRMGHLISPLSGSSANSATQQRATRDDGTGASDLAIWYPLVMTNITIEQGWTWPICPFSSLIYLLDMVIVQFAM